MHRGNTNNTISNLKTKEVLWLPSTDVDISDIPPSPCRKQFVLNDFLVATTRKDRRRVAAATAALLGRLGRRITVFCLRLFRRLGCGTAGGRQVARSDDWLVLNFLFFVDNWI